MVRTAIIRVDEVLPWLGASGVVVVEARTRSAPGPLTKY
jgi:hypothetical protein